jgi:hypothetical protein
MIYPFLHFPVGTVVASISFPLVVATVAVVKLQINPVYV